METHPEPFTRELPPSLTAAIASCDRLPAIYPKDGLQDRHRRVFNGSSQKVNSPCASKAVPALTRSGNTIRACFSDGIKQIDEKYSSVMKNVAAHPFKLMILGRGKDDNLTRVNNQATLDLLNRYGIPHQYKELNGAHSFVFSRRFLASVFLLLFR